MELTKEEMNFILQAMDTHVRANGLSAATNAAILSQKIQIAAQALPATPLPAAPPADPPSDPPADPPSGDGEGSGDD